MTLTGSASITLTPVPAEAIASAFAGSSQRVIRCAAQGLEILGLTPEGPMRRCPTLAARPSRQVLRTRVTQPVTRSVHRSAQQVQHTATGWGEVAVKVVLDPDEAIREAFCWEHELAQVLHTVAEQLVSEGALQRNPVVRVLHPEPIDLGDACVAVSQFVPGTGTPLRVGDWAQTLGMLHLIGSTQPALALLSEHRATHALLGLSADMILEALSRPGHPFGADAGLALEFARTLRERVARAVALDPRPLLVHRDLHALNCINAASGPVAIDWQDAGWGNRSDDFAWLHLAVTRFGQPKLLLERARAAYATVTGGICPTPEQIEASGQVLEMLFLGFSIANADRGPAHLQECLNELPILGDPRARTGRWQLLNNPAIFDPGLVI